MTETKRRVGRPRNWTDEEIEIAFTLPLGAAAARLGRTPKAVEQLRARERNRLIDQEIDQAWLAERGR
jgi:hypothetical protein